MGKKKVGLLCVYVFFILCLYLLFTNSLSSSYDRSVNSVYCDQKSYSFVFILNGDYGRIHFRDTNHNPYVIDRFCLYPGRIY